MNIHCQPLRPGMAILVIFLLFAGCSSPEKSGETPSEIYGKASELGRHGEYAKAIELYDRGLALESLDPPSEGAVLALVAKRGLEGRMGSYDAALATTSVLEGFGEGACQIQCGRQSLWTSRHGLVNWAGLLKQPMLFVAFVLPGLRCR